MSKLRNSEDNYGSIAKILHWTIGGLIIAMLTMGNIMEGLPKDLRIQVIMIHKSTGILILALVVVRVFWRIINKQPTLPEGYSKLIHIGAKAGHVALYILMIAMPLSGWLFANLEYPLNFYGLFNIPYITSPEQGDLRKLGKEAHEVMGNLFIAVVSAHVLAGLYHHYFLKDNVLRRMLPSRRK